MVPGKADVAIIGAGAAGMMCAIEAGKRGRSVLLLDHSTKLAEKIRISGGGRCNFTNLHTQPENFLSSNPDFCRSALARYSPQDFIALVEKHGIGYHEKKSGQLFCNDSAQQIITMLKSECDKAGVTWLMPCQIKDICPAGTSHGRSTEGNTDYRFLLETERGTISAISLVIATGGLSIPKTGATPFGYRLAERFGIAVTPLSPALVPLTLSPDLLAVFADAPGISIDVSVSCGKFRFRESALITHRGLSGPAILQISSYWRPGNSIHINLLPGLDALPILLEHRRSNMLLPNLLAHYLPKRFAQDWSRIVMPAESGRPVSQHSQSQIKQIATQLHDWHLVPDGTMGYKKAEVTLGGVDTRELSSTTMETKKIPGLYFIGEVVDVTGQLGGFNLQWAWASGCAAGRHA